MFFFRGVYLIGFKRIMLRNVFQRVSGAILGAEALEHAGVLTMGVRQLDDGGLQPQQHWTTPHLGLSTLNPKTPKSRSPNEGLFLRVHVSRWYILGP